MEKVGSMSDPIRIMIVEDHAVVRQGLVALLRTVPDFSIVAEAADGREAIELFRLHQPDITLMDLRLPQMNGVEAIGRIRIDFPQARIIVLTTFDGDEDIYRALQAGARGYLLKGMTGEELMDAIRSVYAGKSRIPAPVAERLAERMSAPTLTARETEVLAIDRGREQQQRDCRRALHLRGHGENPHQQPAQQAGGDRSHPGRDHRAAEGNRAP